MYLLVCLALTICNSKLVEYRFGVNFGQVFFDYSGNNNHGVNGDSHLTTSLDTFPTDRGAYFYETINAITIPQNSLVTSDVTLSSTFTILCWYFSGDSEGILFERYKSDDGANNFLELSRVAVDNKLKLTGTVSGSYLTQTGPKDSFKQNTWLMISFVATGSIIKGYCNGIQKVSITFANSYSENGSYLMTIGSNMANALKGYIWYFAIFDNDSSIQSNFYSTSSTNCLTSVCTSCNPSVMDPFFGKGCIAEVSDPTKDGASNYCSGSTYGCSPSGTLDCSICTCGSCSQNGTFNYCTCPSGCTSSIYSCICPSESIAGWTHCCDSTCKTCSLSSKTTCLTCVANNSVPNGNSGCICSEGYYAEENLYNINACTACDSECATCTQASKCLTCKSSNASPDAVAGCICNSGYYSIGSETAVNSCLTCHSECATCNQANVCLTCKSSNASPDSTAGCKFYNGYYSKVSRTTAHSYLTCNSECETCNHADLCLTCKSSNASPDVLAGCNCNSGYYSTGSETAADSCLTCNSECATCTEANKCTACKSSNSSPDLTFGCNCNDGYYSLGLKTAVDSCLTCHSECATCSQADICLTCKSSNANPNAVAGCNCNSGHYSIGSETAVNSCLTCHSECATCSQADQCLTCISSNASPDASVGCECDEGFYSIGLKTSQNSCLTCNSECATCTEANKCAACKSSNSSPDLTFGCNCNDGYYSLGLKTAVDSCLTCHSECATCSQADLCLTCISSNASPDTSVGCECDEGFYSIGLKTSQNSCLTCHSECATCNQADLCLTCISSNASPDALVGCICNDGYYSLGLKNAVDSCLTCNSECETCDQADICLTCKSSNAYPDSVAGCNCNSGYYSIGSETSVNSCLTCHSECATCNQADLCLTCKISNGSPDITVGCICNSGYYSLVSETNVNSCLPCNNECETCVEENLCIACKSFNAIPDLTIGCNCIKGYYSIGSEINDTSCINCNEECEFCIEANKCTSCKSLNSSPDSISGCNCNSGFYSVGPEVESDSCIILNLECETYTESKACATCKSLNAYPDTINGCICEDGYYEAKPLLELDSCQKCHRECQTCFDDKICKTCISKNASPDSIFGCTCNEGYYANSSLENSEACEMCSENCATCISFNKCTKCINLNFIINSEGFCIPLCNQNQSLLSGICRCNIGFLFMNDSCVPKFFNMTLSVNKENKLSLIFSEEPTNFNSSDILVSISSISYEMTIFEKSLSNFFIRFTFTETVPENTPVLVTINVTSLYSKKNSVLDKYNYEDKLYLFEYIPETYKKINSVSKSASQAIVATSFAFSSILDSSGTWIIINTLQFINYIPLNHNNLSPIAKDFILSVGDFNMIPCFTEYIFITDSTSEPFTEAKKIGIDTSVFWINIGPIIIILISFIFLAPFLLCVKALKLGKISVKSSKLLENFKYGTFIRFWIQSFLDIVILAIVQIRSDFVKSHWEYYFNNISAFIALVKHIQLLAFFTLPLVLFKIIDNIDKIQSNDSEFNSKFGSIFNEFKNDRGKLGSIYYPLYFFRRIGFILSQIFLNSFPSIQFGLNAGFTILTLAFLIIYRPFRVMTAEVSNFLGEFAILLVLATSFAFTFELSDSKVKILEIFIISSILFCMLCQIIISLAESIINLKKMIIKYKNKRYLIQSEIC